jgi:hypothetical protein
VEEFRVMVPCVDANEAEHEARDKNDPRPHVDRARNAAASMHIHEQRDQERNKVFLPYCPLVSACQERYPLNKLSIYIWS